MQRTETIAKLYYLLVMADGTIDQKEVEMGDLLIKNEGLDRIGFDFEVKRCEKLPLENVLASCVQELKEFSKEEQIRYVAWTCLIANSDGFMDKEEWALIFKVYHKHLNLPLDEIMEKQRELNATIHAGKKSFSFFKQSQNQVNPA